MRLFNAIAVFDCYVVAETSEEARCALLRWIADGGEEFPPAPSEGVATEAGREQSIRASWRDQRPLVAADVSDADFKKLEGKTTIEIFQSIYTKNREPL